MTQQNRDLFVFIGTYTRLGSEGIYVYRMDASGKLSYVSKAMGIDDPSFLAIDPQRRYLYAASEVQEFEGKSGGVVYSYAINRATGELTLLNRQPTGSPGPCHLTVDKTGRCLLVANYHGGALTVFPIQQGGGLGPASDFVQHEGSSVNPDRQKEAHAHSINLDSSNRFAFAPDLGMDKIMIYQLDPSGGKLKPNNPPWTQLKAGSGPRHFAFHPSERYAYVINELASTVTAFTYAAARGALTEIQTVSTLPEGFTGTSHTADIHTDPTGRFLYGSNRGHDSIAIFSIDQGTGRLTFVGHEPTQGRTPRNFAIDPTGTYLLAANQNSGSIVTFRMDGQTGKLSPTGHVAEVPGPVCLLFMPVA